MHLKSWKIILGWRSSEQTPPSYKYIWWDLFNQPHQLLCWKRSASQPAKWPSSSSGSLGLTGSGHLRADKQIKLQIAVQSLQVVELLHNKDSSSELCGLCKEAMLADELFSNLLLFLKLEKFCLLVGQDCLGLFIAFGMPGKPKDVRGVMLDSINREKQNQHLSGTKALRQFVWAQRDSLLQKKC